MRVGDILIAQRLRHVTVYIQLAVFVPRSGCIYTVHVGAFPSICPHQLWRYQYPIYAFDRFVLLELSNLLPLFWKLQQRPLPEFPLKYGVRQRVVYAGKTVYMVSCQGIKPKRELTQLTIVGMAPRHIPQNAVATYVWPHPASSVRQA